METRRRLVERLEREAHESPARYRLKLALLAALGYAVLGLSLAMTLGVAVFLVLYVIIVRPPADPTVVIPILILGTVGAAVLRALWFRFSEPEGHRLQPDEATGLHEEVERIRHQLGAARLHGIVINDALNAAAAYVPRGFGLWNQRHYLVLGLPLMQLLNRAELAAVIAHEFGHFHGGHGRFGAWIYRLRSSWYRLMEGAAGGWSVGQLLGLFFRWYAPHFDAYSFVLARRQEYAADAVAATVAGEQAMASALVRIGLAAEWLERDFWPGVHQSEHDQSYPPVHVHGRLSAALREYRGGDRRAPRWLLERDAGVDDTHPTLAQRLGALQAAAAPCSDAEADDAAAALLGQALCEKLEQRFSREWREAAEKAWRARHRELELERQRLEELEAHRERSPAERVEYAALAEAHRPGADALPLYRQALAGSPSHGWTRYRLGALLLKRGEAAEGIECLQQAMESDAAVIAPALQSLDEHLRTQPDDSDAYAVAAALRKRYGARVHGGNTPEADGEWRPHALDAAQIQTLARALRGFEKIAEAWVVLQPAGGASALPHYLVLVHWRGSVVSESVGLQRLAGQLRLPGTFTLVTATTQAALARQLKAKAGDPVYRRPR
jgi:Zn-dependent protease with chaperone function